MYTLVVNYSKGIVLACLVFLLAAGCRSAPILNVKDAPINTLSGKEPTLDQVTRAVVLAGMGLNWQMDVVKPGHIVGTLNLRSHQAVVNITYSEKLYSITYKSSMNLTIDPLWDEEIVPGQPPRLIHSNYNSWIQNLDIGIRKQIIATEP